MFRLLILWSSSRARISQNPPQFALHVKPRPMLPFIACSAPSQADILVQIDETLSHGKISITPVARAFLGDLLGADHALSEGELAKLVLRCHGQLAIDVADVEAIVTSSSGAAGSEPSTAP